MEEQKRLDSSRQQRIIRTTEEIDSDVNKLAELPLYTPRTNDIVSQTQCFFIYIHIYPQKSNYSG